MLPPLPDMSLTLEQQFGVQSARQMITDLDRASLEDLFMDIYVQKMMNENLVKGLIKANA